MFEWLFTAIKDWWNAFTEATVDLMYSLLETGVNFFVSYFPAIDWSTLTLYVNYANYFLPLGETINYTQSLIVVWVVAIVIRFIRSHTPVVGG